MRYLYAVIGAMFFLVMIGLMVWKVVDPTIPLVMIIPAVLSGALGLLFTGSSKEGSHG